MLARSALLLAGTATAAVLALAPAQAANARPAAKTKLECKLVFGDGADGKVRYEADARKRQFMATVEVEAPDDDDSDDDDSGGDDDGGDIPLFAAGDELPVTIGTAPAYAAGVIVLAQEDDDELEGALKFDAKARGREVRPFPAGFPALTAGAVVTVGGESCVLQSRGGPKPRR